VVALLQAAAATPPDDTIIRTALYSGLRRGELFGLQWSDVDAGNGQDGGRLHVRRSIYQGAVSTPKTEDSDRAVDVPQRLLDDLAVYKVMHPAIGEGYVFRQATGRPMDPDAWHRERLVPRLRQVGLYRPGAGLHSIRHTYVSLLVHQGEDVRYIADQVGHSTTRLTQDVYAHIFNRVKVDAMRRLNAALPYSNHVAGQAGTPENTTNSVE
jgi:integrase